MKLQSKQRLLSGRDTGVGGGVLFIAQDTKRVLFLLRSPTSEAAGTWCCPGGGIEAAESVEEGIHRECREEIGYDKPIDLQPMHSDHQDNFVFHNYFAFVPHEFDPILNDEHTDYAWLDYFPDPVHPGLMRSIEAYRKGKNEITSAPKDLYEIKPQYDDNEKRNGWSVVKKSNGYVVDVYPTKKYALDVKKELEEHEAKQNGKDSR